MTFHRDEETGPSNPALRELISKGLNRLYAEVDAARVGEGDQSVIRALNAVFKDWMTREEQEKVHRALQGGSTERRGG